MFKEIGGKFVNFDHVKTARFVRHSQTNDRKVLIEYIDGTDESLDLKNWEMSYPIDILSPTKTLLIPAPANYELLHYAKSDDGFEDSTIWRELVIAFSVDEHHQVTAISPISNSGQKDVAIIMPDGKVTIPHDRDFDDIHGFKKYMDTESA